MLAVGGRGKGWEHWVRGDCAEIQAERDRAEDGFAGGGGTEKAWV